MMAEKIPVGRQESYNSGGDMEIIEFPATILSLPPSLEEFRQG